MAQVGAFHAAAHFRAPLRPRAEGDPKPLPYLSDEQDAKTGGVDVTLEVFIETEQMRRSAAPPRLARSRHVEAWSRVRSP